MGVGNSTWLSDSQCNLSEIRDIFWVEELTKATFPSIQQIERERRLTVKRDAGASDLAIAIAFGDGVLRGM